MRLALNLRTEFSVVITALYEISFLKYFRFPVGSLSKALHVFRAACLSVRKIVLSLCMSV